MSAPSTAAELNCRLMGDGWLLAQCGALLLAGTDREAANVQSGQVAARSRRRVS